MKTVFLLAIAVFCLMAVGAIEKQDQLTQDASAKCHRYYDDSNNLVFQDCINAQLNQKGR